MTLEKWEPMKGIEEFFDRYARLMALPAAADEARLKATANDGELTIEIPKKADATALSSPVQVPVE